MHSFSVLLDGKLGSSNVTATGRRKQSGGRSAGSFTTAIPKATSAFAATALAADASLAAAADLATAFARESNA